MRGDVCILLVAACVMAFGIGGCGGVEKLGGSVPSPDEPEATTPQINLGPALAVPLATTPAVGASANVSRLNKLQYEANQPDTVAELKAELNFWVTAAKANPNDSAAQLGLSLIIATAASQNAAHAVGESLFGTTSAMRLAKLGASQNLRPQRLMSDAMVAFTKGRIPPARGTAAGDKPTTTPTASELKQYRAAIQSYLLGPLENVQNRLRTVGTNAAASKKLFTLKIDGSPNTVYKADFRALGAVFGLVRCALLMATSINPDYGTYDWSLDLVQRDSNKDGRLTVAEYAPPSPFGNITAATWTQAGQVLRDAVADMNQALADLTEDPNEFMQRVIGELSDPTEFEANLADAATMLNGQVYVSVYSVSTASTDAAQALTKMPVNLRELWDTPPASVRDLLPPLYLMLERGQFSSGTTPLFNLVLQQTQAVTAKYAVARVSPWVQRTTTIAIGPAPYKINVASGGGFPGINGSFTWNWKKFTGTWGTQSVTATCANPNYGPRFKWSELPDPTLSGVFPNTKKLRDAVYGQGVIIRYRSLVIGGPES